jgi:hypothetical protein
VKLGDLPHAVLIHVVYFLTKKSPASEVDDDVHVQKDVDDIHMLATLARLSPSCQALRRVHLSTPFSKSLVLCKQDFSQVKVQAKKTARAAKVFIQAINGQPPLIIEEEEGHVPEARSYHFKMVERGTFVKGDTDENCTTYERTASAFVDWDMDDSSDDDSSDCEDPGNGNAAEDGSLQPGSSSVEATRASVSEKSKARPWHKRVNDMQFASLCQYIMSRRGTLKSLQIADCVGLPLELAIKLVGLAGDALEDYMVDGESKMHTPSFQVLEQLSTRFVEPASPVVQQRPHTAVLSNDFSDSCTVSSEPTSAAAIEEGGTLDVAADANTDMSQMDVSDVFLRDDGPDESRDERTAVIGGSRDIGMARCIEESDSDEDDPIPEEFTQNQTQILGLKKSPNKILPRLKDLLSHVMRMHREMDIFKRRFAHDFTPLLGGRSWLDRFDTLHTLRDWLHRMQAHVLVMTTLEAECGLSTTAFNTTCPIPLFATLLQDAFILLEAYTTFREVLRTSCDTPLSRLTGVGTTHSQNNFGQFSFHPMREEGRYLTMTWNSISMQLGDLPERFRQWVIFAEMVDQVALVQKSLALCKSFSNFSDETWSFALGVHKSMPTRPFKSSARVPCERGGDRDSHDGALPTGSSSEGGVSFGTLLNCCILDGGLEQTLLKTDEQMERWMRLD